ncbi:MAG TPA: putative baseplate assembly protein [Actinomycetota bacterium]|nr:putative baseplate assembly protein [Actinomycetota bacterium]
MNNQLYCPDEARKTAVRAEGLVNGIDYLEVLDDDAPEGSPRQRTLLVHCFLPVTDTGLGLQHVRIEGGVRVRSVGVEWAYPAAAFPPAGDDDDPLSPAERAYVDALDDRAETFVVRTNTSGDLSTYTLRLVASATETDAPPPDFDVILSSVQFSFKVDCPSEFDCKPDDSCPPEARTEPHVDYLAKDYASFRRVMLDRLAVVMPGWTERNPADVGMTLVELLAYAGDHLSYHQDAVAAEAYLGTARRRVSVRRHARLVDYFVHDGMNARAWIVVEAAPDGGADGGLLKQGAQLLGRKPGAPGFSPALEPDERSGIVFETLHPLQLASARNEMCVYTWRDPRCCLPRGATSAALEGSAAQLGLRRGDALLFEEVRGANGRPEDADPSHRHVVRLSAEPREVVDTSDGTVVVEIAWHAEDALPFALDVRDVDDDDGVTRPASVVRGNVVLADHGMTVGERVAGPSDDEPRYRPTLSRARMTHETPYDDDTARSEPATRATTRDVRAARPAIWLLDDDGLTWRPQRDLLGSGRFATEFVVETEDDGRAHLRFGDGELGRAPATGVGFDATYRVGSGAAGNVGADALTRVVTDLTELSVRNPLPATGGADPESLEEVRQYAPQAFRTQERAVTEDDYARVAERHPEVQRAAATRRWTGSWYTMFVTVDRLGGRAVDADFEARMRAWLERFRMAGYDLEVDAPRFVPLDVVLTVCVASGYLRANVEEALLETFSNRDLPDGRRGFFHPDNLTFGQTVYLSRVIAAAMVVPGVEWIDTSDVAPARAPARRAGAAPAEMPPSPNRFRRWGEESHDELAAGRIELGRLEVARLDNDPNAPENGRIEFVMKGGL